MIRVLLAALLVWSSSAVADSVPPSSLKSKTHSGDDSTAIGHVSDSLKTHVTNSITANVNSSLGSPIFTQTVFGGSVVDPRARTWSLSSGSDSVTAFQGGAPWTIGLPSGAASSALQTAANTILSDILTELQGAIDVNVTFPAVQPVSGTVAVSNFPSSFSVTQGTSPWVTSRNWALTFAGDKVDVSGSSITVTGVATATKQDDQTAELQDINANTDGLEASLASILIDTGALVTQTDDIETLLTSIDTKVATAANQSTTNTRLGDLTETAPATDTASSGLNGRLQRIAQRLTSLIGMVASESTLSSLSSSVSKEAKQDTQISLATSANTKLDTLITQTDGVEATLSSILADTTTLVSQTDGLETLITGTNSNLSTIITHVDGIEGLLGTSNTNTSMTATNTGTLSTNLGAQADSAASSDTGTFSLIALFKRSLQSLTAIQGFLDGVETLLSSAIDQLNGKSVVFKVRNDYASVNVTTGAYVQLVASTSAATTEIYIFDSSGRTMMLALGGAGSEVDLLYIVPGGNDTVPVAIPSGSRVSIKAVSANATKGEIVINAFN